MILPRASTYLNPALFDNLALNPLAFVYVGWQEAMNLRHHEETERDHLAHSIVETITTLLIIILRMVNARMGYIDVQAICCLRQLQLQLKLITSLCRASSFGSQYDATRIRTSIDICCPRPQISSKSISRTPLVHAVDRRDRQTDGRTPDRYTDPVSIVKKAACQVTET